MEIFSQNGEWYVKSQGTTSLFETFFGSILNEGIAPTYFIGHDADYQDHYVAFAFADDPSSPDGALDSPFKISIVIEPKGVALHFNEITNKELMEKTMRLLMKLGFDRLHLHE
ncbi:MAG TPA: hypothetical protein PLI45_04420 [Candidatus Woesebacteria bacterium]|nr:hypothetical protein [Candidatus Woesebacteria bacterium]